MNYTLSKYQKTEGFLHLIFWVLIFSTVNVSWQQDWFDTSIRTNTPSPMSVLVFPLLFYAHAYWAIPKYLVTRKWLTYGISLILIFIGPELIRLVLYALVLNRPPDIEISSRDSFLIGSLNVAWIAFIFSLVYRLVVDRVFLIHLKEPSALKTDQRMDSPLALSPKESQTLTGALSQLMNEKQPFLQQDLNLRALSAHLGITTKKLSTLLNSYMNTTFTDFINEYRVNWFLKEVEAGKLQHLTVSGLMNECGFSSKATFYRAFKKINGCTPTEWLKAKQ